LVFTDLQYPPAALEARTDGTVVVQVTTDGSGRIVGAESIVGPDVLARAAVASVKGWTLAGGPRTDWIVFRFDIDPGACNDDSRSLFRMPYPNLAVVSACTTPGRRGGPPPDDPLYLRSLGATPGYPHFARSANVRGVVILELSADRDGAVIAVRAMSTRRRLRVCHFNDSRCCMARSSASAGEPRMTSIFSSIAARCPGGSGVCGSTC
jgi:hypothetical protein